MLYHQFHIQEDWIPQSLVASPIGINPTPLAIDLSQDYSRRPYDHYKTFTIPVQMKYFSLIRRVKTELVTTYTHDNK